MKTYPFYVRPNLPETLEPLRELAQNFWYSWNWQVVQLFIRMDPDLWEASYQNPVMMLSRMPQERLEELSRDESFIANLRHVYEQYEQYSNQSTWYDREHRNGAEPGTIAYFSCEYGIAEGLPIYSGGLGILSGDHLKSASDLGIPLVAVGLLYQEGYFRQYLNNDGWQLERYPANDWYNMPVRIVQDSAGQPVRIRQSMGAEQVTAQVWEARVGRTPLYLLDTNLPENPPHLRAITTSLYGGDRERRIQQELLLGLGGRRALKALGVEPQVFHMNEGHSAFLCLERFRILMGEKGLAFHEALEVIWASNVFTTHTPVPAGNERFALPLMLRYVKPITDDIGIPWEDFMRLGRVHPSDPEEDFCMTVLALKLSAQCNGVARLHGHVSRHMWRDIWADLPEDEVPIRHVTNGIHTLTWISHDLRELLNAYLGPKLNEKPWDFTVWDRVDRIPDIEFWRMHQRRRERLVFFARKRLREQLQRRSGQSGESLEYASSVLNPGALTIGMARRFATYKRMTLLFRDPDRLHRILADPERPMQIVFAGKAHPQDTPGKEMIKQIIHYSNEPRFRPYVVFIEDYDINVARYLIQGCDIWLNTPRRPLEASGTSGMKAAANGVMNVSVMDGWWDEAYTADRLTTGWSIGRGEAFDDKEYQDTVESEALYDVLERETLPLFYERDRSGLPREWVHRSKSCLKLLAREFNSHRMLMEYTDQMYMPAMGAFQTLGRDAFAKARELAAWRARVSQAWSNVAIASVAIVGDGSNRFLSGQEMAVDIRARLGGLTPDDVEAQLYFGPLNHREEILAGQTRTAELVGQEGDLHVFRAVVPCGPSGRLGYAARLITRHPDQVHPFMTNMVVWE